MLRWQAKSDALYFPALMLRWQAKSDALIIPFPHAQVAGIIPIIPIIPLFAIRSTK